MASLSQLFNTCGACSARCHCPCEGTQTSSRLFNQESTATPSPASGMVESTWENQPGVRSAEVLVKREPEESGGCLRAPDPYWLPEPTQPLLSSRGLPLSSPLKSLSETHHLTADGERQLLSPLHSRAD